MDFSEGLRLENDEELFEAYDVDDFVVEMIVQVAGMIQDDVFLEIYVDVGLGMFFVNERVLQG